MKNISNKKNLPETEPLYIIDNEMDFLKNTRKKWMLDLCDNLFEFYSKEIGTINERILHFKDIQKFWQDKK